MEQGLAEETICEVFTSALELPLESRTEFLDRRCGSTGQLRERVCALLDAHSRSEKFFTELTSATASIEQIPEFLPDELVGGRFTILRSLGHAERAMSMKLVTPNWLKQSR